MSESTVFMQKGTLPRIKFRYRLIWQDFTTNSIISQYLLQSGKTVSQILLPAISSCAITLNGCYTKEIRIMKAL